MIEIDFVKKTIIEKLRPLDPELIILFGSYAHGNPSEDSDIDLYVVTKDDFIPASFSEKQKIDHTVRSSIREILKAYPADIIIHTREMHRQFIASGSSMAREIMNNGIILQ